jgi:predicted phage tail protein
MRLIFHGELRQRFGESFQIHASSIRDAIEGFSRQVNWPRDLTTMVVGHNTADDLEKCPKEVHLAPAIQGGSGKFFNIIVGIAMIGLAFVTGGASLVAGKLVTTALGASLLIGGGLMILQGIVQLFMKAPKFNKSNDPEASKYVSVNQNTTTIGTPITMAWGRIDLGGHWLSLQSDSNQLSFGVFPTTPA